MPYWFDSNFSFFFWLISFFPVVVPGGPVSAARRRRQSPCAKWNDSWRLYIITTATWRCNTCAPVAVWIFIKLLQCGEIALAGHLAYSRDLQKEPYQRPRADRRRRKRSQHPCLLLMQSSRPSGFYFPVASCNLDNWNMTVSRQAIKNTQRLSLRPP